MAYARRKVIFLLAFTFCSVLLAHASHEKTVYAFGAPGSGDGMYPWGNLVADSAGNLYGATQSGGAYDAGIIFELSPGTKGEWTETVLHHFDYPSGDGGYPMAGLVFDAAGNLYGTGSSGGLNGTGVIFELSPQSGDWNYKVIYSFGPYPGSDGVAPNSALLIDKLGNIYGTTFEGGVDSGCFEGCGTVFELSPADKGWSEQVIHAFSPNSSDGELPAGVVFGLGAALYGTTQNGGGSANAGVLYRLKYSKSTNTWNETILHTFTSAANDAGFPEAPLLYRRGILYGTSEGGGLNDHGTVFETTYSKTSDWSTTVLYSFGTSYGDVFSPQASVVMDHGSLYGTATYGGKYNYYGGVFKLSKSSDGNWSETVLHSFNGTDGDVLSGALLLQDGWFYGNSRTGGDSSGLVYAVKP